MCSDISNGSTATSQGAYDVFSPLFVVIAYMFFETGPIGLQDATDEALKLSLAAVVIVKW
jgi:hypothetical protein